MTRYDAGWRSDDGQQRSGRSAAFALCLVSLLSVCSGCTTLLSPMTGTAVSRLPPELLGERRSEYVSVPAVMLAIPPQPNYRLDAGDVLGVYIEGVLPFDSPTSPPQPPPVNFPEAGSGLPPSIGFPIAVQEEGMLNLPLIDPFSVQDMTLEEARQKIGDVYRARDILASQDTVPVVTLIKRRTYGVTVLREAPSPTPGSADGTTAGQQLQLPAYENDVLHALTLSGGLPGFNEKNQVTIYKTSRIPYERRNEVMMHLMNPCEDSSGRRIPLAPGGHTIGPNGSLMGPEGMIEERFEITIPLRVPPGQMPDLSPSDIELDEGDIVLVESRETEIFYTGGLLPGGQFPLPRDYDLDVLGALALAGAGVDNQQTGGGGGGGGLIQGIGGVSPTQLFVIRKLPCGRTFNIAVDLQQALNDSTQNILVQPGDTLVLRYKPHEEVLNFGLGTFFTFGIRELFSND